MKTKLTLLLALALSAESATAASPNLPVIKPSALPSQAIRPAAKVPNIPMQRSNVFVPANRSAVPMIKPSARLAPSSYLPKMPAIRPVVPQYVQPRSNGGSTSRRGGSAAPHAPSAPAAIPGKSPVSRNLPAKPQIEIRKVTPGLSLPNAEGIRQGREIANGLQSIESLRGSISSLREFGDVFHQPGNSGPNDGGNIFAPFGGDPGPDGNTEVHNPLDRSTNRRPRDIRGDMAKTRPADGSTGLSPTGDSVLESETSTASGRDGTHTPVQSTTEENGDVTATTTATTRDGSSTTSVEVTEHADGSGTTTTTHGDDGRVDNLTVTRRDRSGAVIWSRSETVYPGGKAIVETRDGSGRVTSHSTEYYTPRPRSRGPHPDDHVIGGPPAPSAKAASGLVPIDLLRQFAEGQNTGGGGSNYMTRGIGGVEVNPGNPNGNPEGNPGSSGGSARRLKKDLFDTISNPGPHGGEGPLVGGTPRD
jgi:hypothetical protein